MSRIDEPMGQTSGGEMQTGTRGVRETAGQVQQNLRDLGGQMKSAAAEQYGHLRDQASDYYERGRQAAEEWEQSLEEYVHEKPIQSLMIAAGVGLLLGLLWKR
jgi:ElaB/YqjD/DUF883 family membrane-anchored ribosome-binding protein